ncbi:hypothetical protein PFISCL1PPCAC_26072, partial [Pristionchus fissidentatus]
LQMSSSGRTPLTSMQTSRDAALTRATATKLKRRSISLANGGGTTAAAGIKRLRTDVSAARPTAAAAASTSRSQPTRPVRPPTPTNLTTPMNRPLPGSMVTGRATVAAGSVARPSAIRPPSTVTRTRTLSGSTSRGVVDEEKAKMRADLAEAIQKVGAKSQECDLLTTEKEELAKSNDELRRELVEVKGKVRAEKNARETTVMELQEERRAHEETREALARSKESETRLKREAIDKDEAMRVLHNAVVDLKGRIRVSVRVRPALGKEREESTEHLSYPEPNTIGFAATGKDKPQPFAFNNVYGPNYSQSRIFESVQELILSVLHGYNVSLVAYGQTGSGKTHTMRGGEGESEGLIPRAVRYLFEQRHRLEDLDWKFDFFGSFLEVYNNECYDLLSTPARAKREIKQINGKFVVDDLTSEPIADACSMATLLRKSDRNRTTAATACNETSSRSHAMFTLTIKGKNETTGATIDCVLKLVDLAGSERAKETGATGDRFTEMTHINTALSNLQTCIRSILTKQAHVPYRNSKLTTLLQDSLGGGSKCMVILSLAPHHSALNETKRSLEFGRNMSQTFIGVAKKKET